MEWLEIFRLAIENPVENFPLWVVLGAATMQILRWIYNGVIGFTKSMAQERQGNQAIITQDNSLQGKLIDEMAARRASDEKFRNRLADILDEKVTRIDSTTVKIDGTTIATQSQIGLVLSELAALHERQRDLTKAMGIMYRKMKAEGVLE